MGSKGWYTSLSPNFDTASFDETKGFEWANQLTPFGFAFNESVPENSPSNTEQATMELRRKVFKLLVEKLDEKRKAAGADYILIELITDHPGRESLAEDVVVTWYMEMKCQFFNRIAFQHVDPPKIR